MAKGLTLDDSIDKDRDRDVSPSSTGRTKGPLDQTRAPMKLRMAGNKREGIVSPKVRSRRKSRSFRVR